CQHSRKGGRASRGCLRVPGRQTSFARPLDRDRLWRSTGHSKPQTHATPKATERVLLARGSEANAVARGARTRALDHGLSSLATVLGSREQGAQRHWPSGRGALPRWTAAPHAQSPRRTTCLLPRTRTRRPSTRIAACGAMMAVRTCLRRPSDAKECKRRTIIARFPTPAQRLHSAGQPNAAIGEPP